MIERWLMCAVDVARRAGELQRGARDAGVAVEAKGAADIVTEVDRACERVIVEAVRRRFPDHGILAEEGAAHNAAARCVWIVDPLDGTKNYAHGSARCGVSVAVSLDGEAVVAVVYAPFVDELFTATRSTGAQCNGRAIRVSSVGALPAAMVASAMTYRGRDADPSQLARLVAVFGAAQAVRSTGSAALDLADVARGRFDAYFEPGLAPWDTAAGALLVREAGGLVTDFAGAAHRPDAPDLIASNGLVHAALRERLGAPP